MKDQEEISRMLAGLRAVEAPENFDGSVRTRIAERRGASSLSRPTLWLAAKFAIPMLVLLMLGAFLMFSDDRAMNADMVPSIADDGPEVATFDDVQAAQPDPGGNNVADPAVSQVPVNRNGRAPQLAPQGGSEDMTLTQDDTTVFPDGVDPRKAKVVNAKPPSGGKISADSLLTMIGITTECSGSGCSTTAVREGSIAANSGVRAGDQIVAIDGRAINASSTIEGRFTLSELTLVRDGRRMILAIGRR